MGEAYCDERRACESRRAAYELINEVGLFAAAGDGNLHAVALVIVKVARAAAAQLLKVTHKPITGN